MYMYILRTLQHPCTHIIMYIHKMYIIVMYIHEMYPPISSLQVSASVQNYTHKALCRLRSQEEEIRGERSDGKVSK